MHHLALYKVYSGSPLLEVRNLSNIVQLGFQLGHGPKIYNSLILTLLREFDVNLMAHYLVNPRGLPNQRLHWSFYHLD